MTDNPILRLRELLAKATPGPWEVTICDDGYAMVHTAADIIFNVDFNHQPNEHADAANAELAALAKTALPALLDRLEKAEAESAAQQADITDLYASLTAAVERAEKAGARVVELEPALTFAAKRIVDLTVERDAALNNRPTAEEIEAKIRAEIIKAKGTEALAPVTIDDLVRAIAEMINGR